MALLCVHTWSWFFFFLFSSFLYFCLFVVQNIHIHFVVRVSYIGTACKIPQLLFYLHWCKLPLAVAIEYGHACKHSSDCRAE
ncbi:hypothetical protein P167DRAFT_214884 [Morchella conica CCBAS932]|uniref:Uncharacterized protein n=1 Tax=Morchella conica CCBAS932 TaxID=1392247 RepID=A0A3N4KPT1_9PEZI|nr:hypothetical protein P167DRAFT_214884 [Morchella conica CCBAS932]